MKQTYILLIFVILFITACQEKIEQTPLHKEKEDLKQHTNASETRIENTEANQQEELVLKLEQPNKKTIQLTINDQLPILMSYLKQFDNPKNEVERMRTHYLFSAQQKSYFLVSYSCGTKLCNQLLLENNQDNIQSLEVSEASIFQDFTYTSNNLAFLFGRNEGSKVLRNQVVNVNLNVFQKIAYPKKLVSLESFEYPIPNIEWKNNTLIVSIADIESPSYESIKQWYENKEHPVNEIKWSVR